MKIFLLVVVTCLSLPFIAVGFLAGFIANQVSGGYTIAKDFCEYLYS